MNFIDRLVFPKPKVQIPIGFENEVIFIPSLKEPISYKILREVLLKQYFDLTTKDSKQNGKSQNSETRFTSFNRFERNSSPNPPTNPSLVFKKELSIEMQEEFVQESKKDRVQINPEKNGSEKLNIEEQTLDFIEQKNSAQNLIHAEFERKLVVVNRDKAKTLTDSTPLSLNSLNLIESTNHSPHGIILEKEEEVREIRLLTNYPTCETIPGGDRLTQRSRVYQSKSINIYESGDRSKVKSLTSAEITNISLISLDLKLLKSQMTHKIPVLYLPNPMSRLTVVYFHSNAEDITMLEGLCECLRETLNCNVMAMEYAGYSLHNDLPTSADNISNDAENVIHFLRKTLELRSEEVYVIGRSIGSGPALHVASKFTFGMVITVAGLLSVRAIVEDRISFFGRIVSPYFDNAAKVLLNKSPLLLIHGKNDDITPAKHSEMLYEKSKSKSKIIIFDDMPHNNFDFVVSVIGPIKDFQKTLEKSGSKSSRRPRVVSFEAEKNKAAHDFFCKLHNLLTQDFLR
jgi:esterase/lipase